jgi:cyclic pyranopterin phosphate synthase
MTAVRITGGEPLVRRRLPSFVQRLADLGFEDLAMTTNAPAIHTAFVKEQR